MAVLQHVVQTKLYEVCWVESSIFQGLCDCPLPPLLLSIEY